MHEAIVPRITSHFKRLGKDDVFPNYCYSTGDSVRKRQDLHTPVTCCISEISKSEKKLHIFSTKLMGKWFEIWGHIARRRIAGSYSNSMLNFLRNLYSVFHRCGTYGPWDISQPRDATLPFATMWMDLEIVLLSQISLENLTTMSSPIYGWKTENNKRTNHKNKNSQADTSFMVGRGTEGLGRRQGRAEGVNKCWRKGGLQVVITQRNM